MKNEKVRLRKVILLLSILTGSLANGQSIFENPITGPNPNTSNPYIIGQSSNPNIVVSGIGRGSGITGSNGNNRYNANNWTQGATADNNDFFYFTLTPNSCYEIDFNNLELTFERSSTGPQNISLRSSLDNFAQNIWSYNWSNSSVQNQTISLAGSQFQVVSSSITFRVYGWSASAGTGTLSINSFKFNGTVNSFIAPVAGTISGLNSVCSGSGSTLALSGYQGNIQWQISTDNLSFSNIVGANGPTYSTGPLQTPRYYRAVLSSGNCSSVSTASYLVNITQSELVVTGASE